MWECLSEQYEKTNKIDAITFVSSIHNLSTCKKVTTLKPFYNHGTIAHAFSSPTIKLLNLTSQPNPIKLNHSLYSSTKCARNILTPISESQSLPSQQQPPFPSRSNIHYQFASTNLSETITKPITTTSEKEIYVQLLQKITSLGERLWKQAKIHNI